MLINEITQGSGQQGIKRKRIGRGIGSHGKTSGRGHKGESSRSGAKAYLVKDGGQMPFFRKVAKRGFSQNRYAHSERTSIVDIARLNSIPSSCETINLDTLKKHGLSHKSAIELRLVGSSALTKSYNIHAKHITRSATKSILSSGGAITLT